MAKRRRKVVEEEVEGSKKAPVGVQIISVIYYIAAVLCAIAGILFIVGANAIVALLVASAPQLGEVSSLVFIVLGIVLIAIGVLAFFVGRGLWKLKSWARILAIIFAILGVMSAIYSMVKGFAVGDAIKLVVHAFMGAYLTFSKESIQAFK